MAEKLHVRLAGFNVDTEILKHIPDDPALPVTPETISAAYARISRSALDVTQLRRLARQEVAKTRASNSKIIFEMGHHSIAEHAVFNFDIMGISRLAMEEIERLRLVSYTEKSQRYVKLKGDYSLPEEIIDSGLRSRFADTVGRMNEFYQNAFLAIERKLSEPREAREHSPQQIREKAKEDARYGLPLATRGQLGMTINARNLEHLLRRTANSALMEVRRVGELMYQLVRDIAPSLILFPEPSAFDKALNSDFRSAIREIPLHGESSSCEEVTLIEGTEDGDDGILAAFLSHYGGSGLAEARKKVDRLPPRQKKELFEIFFREMSFFDSPPREFELVLFTFDTVVSAACYAQLKRHRMATLIPGPYLPSLGITLPDTFTMAGVEPTFAGVIAAGEALFDDLLTRFPSAAPYILTNAHRRRVIVKMNLRELYHFARLRQDAHAQWDIRRLADRMVAKVREYAPLASMLLCGKSDYPDLYKAVFHKNPR